MDEGELNGVLFFDLRKAFDSINHYIPTEKLKCYNIEPGAIKLQWKHSCTGGMILSGTTVYQSYLTNRTEFTVLFSEESNRVIPCQTIQ